VKDKVARKLIGELAKRLGCKVQFVDAYRCHEAFLFPTERCLGKDMDALQKIKYEDLALIHQAIDALRVELRTHMDASTPTCPKCKQHVRKET